MSASNKVVLFSDAELILLDKLGMRLRKSKVKVEKTTQELALIEKAKGLGYVTKGGGDGSKERLNKGVGDFVRSKLFEDENLSNKDLLALVNKKYSNTNTTIACVAWYKNDVRKNWTKGITAFTRTKV